MKNVQKTLGLSIHEYCAEDDTRSVRGKFPEPVDLHALKTAAEKISTKVMLMERLQALVIPLNQGVVHIHANGDIVINRIKRLEDAEEFMEKLLCAEKQ
ncbi:MAG TPA: hypothetical protein PKM67_10745 [Kiritimatiellia bacterium]|nr:hypothetical protein [Kiritimatiellia bacterium]HNS81923.1 hypothetical protein [Kiritimatiellia bacterium]